jgi:hypothetical protein
MGSVRDQAPATRALYGLRLIFLDNDLHRLPTAFGAGQNVLSGICVGYSHTATGYLDHLASVERGGAASATRRGFAAGRLATRTERDDVCRGSAFAPLVEYGRIILFLRLFLFAFAQIAGIN